jgi:hypothetical protein
MRNVNSSLDVARIPFGLRPHIDNDFIVQTLGEESGEDVVESLDSIGLDRLLVDGSFVEQPIATVSIRQNKSFMVWLLGIGDS